MSVAQDLFIENGCASFRPVGEFTLPAITAAIGETIAYCRETGICCLLADIRGVTGFEPPTVGERFLFISQWAEASGGKVNLSLVVPPEMIHEEKFGVLMADFRGMPANVFTDHDEAVNWLKECAGNAKQE